MFDESLTGFDLVEDPIKAASMPKFDGFIGSAIGAIGGLVGASKQSDAAKRAASAARDVGEAQMRMQNQWWETGRSDMDPYRKAGYRALQELGLGGKLDVTGGAGQFQNALKDLLGQSFQLDTNDPVYKWKQDQMQTQINQAMAARGGYDSRVALNALQQGNMALADQESQQQWNRYLQDYGRKSGTLMDLFNQSMQLGGTKYNHLMDLIKIGTGASAATGAQAQQLGTNLSNVMGNVGGANVAGALRQGEIAGRTWEGLGGALGSMADDLYSKYGNKNNALTYYA